MARRCLNTEAQRHRARSCTVPDASRVAGAGKVRLGDVCSFSKGQQINGKELSDSYDYPFINGGVSPSGNWKDYNVEKGAITISEGGNSCGFVNYFEVPFWCGAHCYYFYELKLEPKYFYYALKANEERLMGLRSGICMPNIRKGDLDEFEFCIDWDKATQQRIADELDRLCAMKKNAEDRLAILDQIVKSRFVEMFGNTFANPKGWKTLTFKDASLRLSDGPFGSNLKSSHYSDSGVRVIRLGNIGVGEFLNKDQSYIPAEHYEKLRKYTCRKGELVFGTLGEPNLRACIIPDYIDIAVNKSDCVHCIPKPELFDTKFVCAYVNAPGTLELAAGMVHGQTRSRVSSGQIAQMPIYLPPLALQRKFAAFVAEVDKSKFAVRKSLEELQKLYRQQLQEAFG